MIACLTLVLSLVSITGMAQTEKSKSQTSSSQKSGVKKLPSKPIDINSATEKQLTLLPGVGPRTAERIIEARPFKSVQELRKVKGIGAKKFEGLEPHVVCGKKETE